MQREVRSGSDLELYAVCIHLLHCARYMLVQSLKYLVEMQESMNLLDE